MKSSNKKEVSCKAVNTIFYYAKKKGVALDSLIAGVPYDLPYLLNKHERIGWSDWSKIIFNSRKYFTRLDYEQMGRDFVKSGSYVEGILTAFVMFSTSRFTKILLEAALKMAAPMFSCLNNQIEIVDKNKLHVMFYFDEGCISCPEFFYISKGTWEELGTRIGHREFRVDVTITANGGIFDVSWRRETFIYKITRWFKWLFNIRKAFYDLNETHIELLNEYNKLEDSKELLQKQTTQLKTAHEISTSIRQSLDINDTLKTLTEILISEAGFTFASIHLFKDLDSNNIEIKSETGENIKSISQIKHEIIINEQIIGEIVLNPVSGIDYREVNELINYLSPVINIAIHDALVFRTIVDYRDNLEKKVAERTIDLQNARDQLSDTNVLLKEAQQIQNRFFTNISHEFRTPLTLIQGPAKQIIENTNESQTKDSANFIYRNSLKLIGLVNQLLDLSKLEAGEMTIRATQTDVIAFIKEIVLSFTPLADRKKITLKLNHDEEQILAYLDRDKIYKIINNILSNAFKFTAEDGKINISIVKNISMIEIKISDTGIGIPEEKIDKIFDRFYQVDGSHTREQEGTGIGLALTKELVELHKGKIEVESKEGEGSTFTISFPLGKDHLQPEQIVEIDKSEDHILSLQEVDPTLYSSYQNKFDTESLTHSQKPTLLVVEDNTDVRSFIRGIFKNEYEIYEASNGEEGMKISFEEIPDLIISDLMMPKMDGMEMCNKIKNDERTSHIPVIMLTAKAANKDKIEGYETGADDYITKPFDAEVLKARVKNLVEQRKKLKEHFVKDGLFNLDDKNITQVDKVFLQKVIQVVNNHLSDTSFGVETFASDIALSRVTLHKKLVSLIGEPPSELIKRIRLSKAAKLLQSKRENISEIALDVGFNNPAYFSECFKKQFGVSPSQYQQKLTNH
jgi:signal transduction histidine kinase/DNA-binding response OmpR family regulator